MASLVLSPLCPKKWGTAVAASDEDAINWPATMMPPDEHYDANNCGEPVACKKCVVFALLLCFTWGFVF